MVYTIGETVLDIIIKTFDDIVIRPGGSMLNSSISLGRLGVNVSHISSISTDKSSDKIVQFLHDNGVDSKYINRSINSKTSLALAYLNNNNDAEYTFYKDKNNNVDILKFPTVLKGDIIHYGSFFSINKDVHIALNAFLSKINNNHCIKLYDPNFRKPHLPQLSQLMPMIENNFKNADIVKASDEDFENIYGIKNGEDAWNLMKSFGVSILFYTKGKNGSEFFSNKGIFSKESKQIVVKSTIGAGDTYSASIIYFLNSLHIDITNLHEISIEKWHDCVDMAHEFSAHTCQSLDNYLSKEFCRNI